jgi:hypothetical protein
MSTLMRDAVVFSRDATGEPAITQSVTQRARARTLRTAASVAPQSARTAHVTSSHHIIS